MGISGMEAGKRMGLAGSYHMYMRGGNPQPEALGHTQSYQRSNAPRFTSVHSMLRSVVTTAVVSCCALSALFEWTLVACWSTVAQQRE